MSHTEQMREALEDLLNGWKYIRRAHGDLYGVGWDRAQAKGEAALAALTTPAAEVPEAMGKTEILNAWYACGVGEEWDCPPCGDTMKAIRAILAARDAQWQSTRLRGGVPEGHAPYSINEIEAWADDADKHGLKFVPVSSATLRLIVGGLRATRCGVPEGWKPVPVEPTREMMEAMPSLPAIGAPGDMDLKTEGWSLKAIQNRHRWLAALTAAPQAPAQEPSIEIDFKQATELLAMFGGEPSLVTLMPGDGHSGKGLYAYWTDIPGEGAIYLGVTDDDAAPQAPAPALDAATHPTKDTKQ